MADNPFAPIGWVDRIFGPTAGAKSSMYEAQHTERLRQEEGSSRARALAHIAKLKAANPKAPPDRIIFEFLSSPEGIDMVATNPLIGGFVTEALGAMQPPPPERIDVTQGNKSVAIDPLTKMPIEGSEISQPTTEEQEQQFMLDLTPEQRNELARINIMVKNGETTQAERAVRRLTDANVITEEIGQKQLAGFLEVVDNVNEFGEKIGGSYVVDTSVPGGRRLDVPVDAVNTPVAGGVVAAPAAVPGQPAPAAEGGDTLVAMRNLIGNTEGTDAGAGYNETLGYGAFTNGPVNLVGMTLDEVDALQTQMLRHPDNPYNSSAAGRYQIVQETLRGLRQELGLNGTELYDEAMQDRLANALLARRGSDPAGLRQEWVGLGKASDEQIAAAMAGQEVPVSFGGGSPGARQPAQQGPAQPGGRGGPARRNTQLAPPPVSQPGQQPRTGFGLGTFGGGAGLDTPGTGTGLTGVQALEFGAGPTPAIANWVGNAFGSLDPAAVNERATEARYRLASLEEAVFQWQKSAGRGGDEDREGSNATNASTRKLFQPTNFLTNPLPSLIGLRNVVLDVEARMASDEAIVRDKTGQPTKLTVEAQNRINKGQHLLKMIGSKEDLAAAIVNARKLQVSGHLLQVTDQFKTLIKNWGTDNNAITEATNPLTAPAKPGEAGGVETLTMEELLRIRRELSGGQ